MANLAMRCALVETRRLDLGHFWDSNYLFKLRLSLKAMFIPSSDPEIDA